MRKLIGTLICCSVLVAPLSGCGKPSEKAAVSVEQSNKPKSTAELKSRLEEVAKSGQTGSILAGMRSAIEGLESKEKSAELLKDFSKLESAKSPKEVTTIATEMAGKL